VARANGKGTRRIVHLRRTAETEPVFSPDGRSIMWVHLQFGAGDVSFSLKASLWRASVNGRNPGRVRKLPTPNVEEGDFYSPDIAWQPLP
jgi:hypothetical protein